jgi:cytoskeletal protein CcmA (bactofilin family)
MANPTLPASFGLPVPLWANDQNNWRANDATWLLARSVLRFASTTDRDAASAYKVPGALHYISTGASGYFLAKIGTGTVVGVDEKKVFLADNLSAPVDTSTSITLKLTSGTLGLQMEPNKVTISGMTTGSEFNVGRVRITSTGFLVHDANNVAVTLTKDIATDGGQLRVGGGLVVNNATTAAGTLTVTGTTTLNAAVQINANTTATGMITAPTFAVAGAPTVANAFNGNLNGNVTATNVGVGVLNLTGSTITNSQGATPNVVEVASTGINLKTQGTMRTKLSDNNNPALAAQVATVVASASAPVAQDYPEGCLWVQI